MSLHVRTLRPFDTLHINSRDESNRKSTYGGPPCTYRQAKATFSYMETGIIGHSYPAGADGGMPALAALWMSANGESSPDCSVFWRSSSVMKRSLISATMMEVRGRHTWRRGGLGTRDHWPPPKNNGVDWTWRHAWPTSAHAVQLDVRAFKGLTTRTTRPSQQATHQVVPGGLRAIKAVVDPHRRRVTGGSDPHRATVAGRVEACC